jgi:hypothetical protein
VDIDAITDIDGDREPRVAIGGYRPPLRVAQPCPATIYRAVGERPPARELHHEERQRRPELPAPVRHHSAQQRLVMHGVVQRAIRFTLVPGDAAQAIPAERRDHAVVEHADAVQRFPRRVRGPESFRDHLVFPVRKFQACAIA